MVFSVAAILAFFPDHSILWAADNAGTRALVPNASGSQKITSIRGALPELHTIFNTEVQETADGAIGFWPAVETQDGRFTAADTLATDPALIIHTSGTTGKPRGALHAQQVLLGHLPGVEISHNFFPDRAELMWMPVDREREHLGLTTNEFYGQTECNMIVSPRIVESMDTLPMTTTYKVIRNKLRKMHVAAHGH